MHAKVIKHHNIAVIVNTKSVHHQLQHRHSIIIKTLLQLCLLHPDLDCKLQHFLELGDSGPG